MATDQNNVERVEDNYLVCSKYEGHPDSPAIGFTTFQNENGQYYFSMVGGSGKVIFRSEGYPTTAARDNGLASVQKNSLLRERYSIDTNSKGETFVVLKAGNHQEIARSCPYANEADAYTYFPFLAEGYTGDVHFKSFDAAPVAAAAATVSDRNIDEYLDCEAYAGHTDSPEKGFTTFKTESGEYYFAVVDANGKVLFRSEGYPTAGARDNGIQSVIKNRDNKDRYKVVQEDGKYYVALRAGNNQEIARSCAFDSEPNIDALYFAPVAKALVADADRNIDEYLACDEYRGHTESPVKDFVTFKKGDQHYFAMLDGDGGVKLRSEGYPTTGARDNGMQSVIKNKDIKERYKVVQEDGKYYLSLRAGNNQEIARSCGHDSEAALWGLFPYLAPAGALAFGAASAKGAVAAAAATAAAAVAPKIVEAVAPKEAAPVVAAYEEASRGGGFKWWWLLPLLLLPLLWCMFNDCGCAKKETPIVTDSLSSVVTPAPVVADTTVKDSVKTETPAPVATTTDCNCDGSAYPIFNTSGTAKSLHRLGSNPEFGWSHGLTAKQFYNKLKSRHASNSVDRNHLEGVAKAMGYNSFADLTPDMFTEVKLPKGTTGNLGYSKQHKFGLYTLDMDKERDLEAFHIQSKNGCDIHYMKTCGNIMFFCNK